MNQFLGSITGLLLLFACGQEKEDRTYEPCRIEQVVRYDTAHRPLPHPGRGALLASRINSFDELQSVLQIEYETNPNDSLTPQSTWVKVSHCSAGKMVQSMLTEGPHQGDFMKVRDTGDVFNRFALLLRCPYAVTNRADLDKVFALARLRPEWFGPNDQSFFDLAKNMTQRINTPAQAFLVARDSSEKGMLNTFNHFTAQAFVTTCFSEELADFIADSHERYRHPELISGRFAPGQLNDPMEGPIDNYIDLINNEWGQELGKQLREKYQITPTTIWTPELMTRYLNDILAYYSWAFQIGFKPYQANEGIIIHFSTKLRAAMGGLIRFR